MKYRRLTSDELRELEQEFIHFLAAAQITAQDWERMKKNQTFAAEELIETFSDMVYEKVLGNIKLLEYRDSKTLHIFKFETDKILLVGLSVNENSPIDLTKPGMFSKLDNDNMGAISVIKTQRAYKGNKQMEVFDLIQNGCVVTDEKLFDLIMNLA